MLSLLSTLGGLLIDGGVKGVHDSAVDGLVPLRSDFSQFLLPPQLLQFALAVEHLEFVGTLILLVEELQDFRGQTEDAPDQGAEDAATEQFKHGYSLDAVTTSSPLETVTLSP